MKIIITEEEIKGTPNNYDLGELVRRKYVNILTNSVNENVTPCKCGKNCANCKKCSNGKCCMDNEAHPNF
jgi:hypothetical protein